MDLGLERDFNVEVEVESKTEGVALSAATALLVDGLTSDAAQCVGHTADEAARRLPNIAELEVVQRALLLLLLLTLAAPSLRRSIVL